jgi:3-dehydroquinate synthase
MLQQLRHLKLFQCLLLKYKKTQLLKLLQLDLGLISADLAADHLEILQDLDLPVSYKRESWTKLLAHMAVDKKSRGSSLRFVTISEIGKTDRLENPDPKALYAAYEKVSS